MDTRNRGASVFDGVANQVLEQLRKRHGSKRPAIRLM
jgi:hypothetical protein